MIIYMMEYYSAIKKNEIMPFSVTWRVSYWVKEVRGVEISYYIPYMWTLKGNDANEFIYRTETDSQT